MNYLDDTPNPRQIHIYNSEHKLFFIIEVDAQHAERVGGALYSMSKDANHEQREANIFDAYKLKALLDLIPTIIYRYNCLAHTHRPVYPLFFSVAK